MFGNPHFFDTAQFREMLQSFRKGIEKDDRWFLVSWCHAQKWTQTKVMGLKACKDLHTVAAIALELAQSSIRSVEDLWSSEKIEFVIHPQPQIMTRTVLEEIVVRSVEKYLERPGHVLLPDGMISTAEFEKERHNPLLRVRKLWEYWHGSPTLNNRTRRMVSKILNVFFPMTDDLTMRYFRSISISKSLNAPEALTPGSLSQWW